LASLNYPGILNPKIKFFTKLTQTDGLNHSAAVQYELLEQNNSTETASLCLPEEYNGLGYQNLISMVFKLMSFRDAWMRVGKAKLDSDSSELTHVCPIHLVLVEEPEAHLHAQVQQVFVRKAYDVLRNLPKLEAEGKTFQTQLVVSTHSSHIAHETEFSRLRYFQRNSGETTSSVSTSNVINLSEVFGKVDETERFVSRYLKSTHCDLFFADAAILVEGSAERILIPSFIRRAFPNLHKSYLTILEIGGSHAHRFKNLIERLGIPTLVITDLDSVSPVENGRSVNPKRHEGFETSNGTLKKWHPCIKEIDKLLELKSEDKNLVNREFPNSKMRIAYQIPIKVTEGIETSLDQEFLASTFEHSLIFENLEFFKSLNTDGPLAKLKTKLGKRTDPISIEEIVFGTVKDIKKADFALDILTLENESISKTESRLDDTRQPIFNSDLPEGLKIPAYISEGLTWLEGILVPNSTALNDNSQRNTQPKSGEVIDI
jgi:hypothetical protein